MFHVTFDLNRFSPATAEAMYVHGRYMSDPSYRTSNTYYFARIASWYFESLTLPGRPRRTPTDAEFNGLLKIPTARQETRKWLTEQLDAGRDPNVPGLASDTTAFFISKIKNDTEMTAAIAFIKESFGANDYEVAVVTPSFNELWQQVHSIDNRSRIDRCQSLNDVSDVADAQSVEQQRQRGDDPQGNEYDQIRIDRTLEFVNEYDSPESPLEGPPTENHVYGKLSSVEGV